MALKDHWNDPDRMSRLKMDDEASRAEKLAKQDKAPEASDTEKPKVQGYRIRGKLYDKIKVSVKTMDIVIGVLVGLLVIALIVGVATGKRP